jgi:hypothetical protein
MDAPNSMRVARAAARRLLARRLINATGRSLCWAGAVSAILVTVDRLGVALGPWPWLVFAPLMGGLSVALVLSLLRRHTLIEAAGVVDRALGLKDRISTAVSLTTRGSGGGLFERWAIEEAEQAAKTARIRRVVPMRVGWAWAGWPVIVTACVLATLLVPRLKWDQGREKARADRIAVREAASEHTASVIEQVREALQAQPGDLATPGQLAALEEIATQLRNDAGSSRDGLAKVADRVGSLAQDLERDAERSRQAFDELRSRLASAAEALKHGVQPETGRGRSLEEALRRGDFGAASRDAEELAHSADTLSPQERARAAENLERFAEAVRPEPRAPQAEDNANQSDRRGLTPEQFNRLREMSDPEQIARDLETQGFDQEVARRQADRIARNNQTREAVKEAAEHQRQLQESLREAAEQLRKRPPATGDQTPSDAPSPSDRSPDAVPGGDDRRPSGQPESRPDAVPGASGQPEMRSPPRPTEDVKPRGEPKPSGQQSPSGTSQTREPGNAGQVPASKEDQPQRPGEPGGSDGRPQGAPEPAPGGSPSRGLERLRDTLQRLAQREGGAEDAREQAERLRQAARELIDNASPEQREELARRWGGSTKGARESVPPAQPRAWTGATTPVDVRRGPGRDSQPREDVIAEWYSRDRGTGASAQPRMDQVLRQAARSAEEAIEQQVVPTRYTDLVRRVFKRYEERAEPPAHPPGP